MSFAVVTDKSGRSHRKAAAAARFPAVETTLQSQMDAIATFSDPTAEPARLFHSCGDIISKTGTYLGVA